MTINPERKNSASLEFDPGSTLALQDLHTTDATTSMLPIKLGYLVEANQRGYSARLNYSGEEHFAVFYYPLCALWMDSGR